MGEQELKDLSKRQQEELKKIGINNMEELKRAMEETELDISVMVAPLSEERKEIA